MSRIRVVPQIALLMLSLAALVLWSPGILLAQTPTKWVSGYYAGWFWDWQGSAEAVAAVDMTTMTHFIFGRYAPGAGGLGGSAGQLLEGAGTGHTSVEDALVAKAHTAGVTALAMLGGAGDGGGWVASTAPAVRATFISNILNKCVAKNYDGVDVDWEDSLDTPTAQGQLIAFLTELRAAAAARTRYQAPNRPFVITFPGYSVNINTDLPVPSWKVTVASLVDQYNLMSYGMTYNCCGWDTWLWAALKDAGPSHPTSIESSIQAYVDAGVPRSKMGMGLGLYASGYSAPVTGPRQPMSTEYFWADHSATWADLYNKGMLSSGYQFDAAAQTGYYTYSPPRSYQGNSVSMVITEDLQSIAAKGAWAKAGNCGGAIVWTINYGYVGAAVGNPPMQAVKQAFLETATSHTLTVAKAGVGSGTVTSSPPGISCGADCSEPYNSGAVVTLSQAAAAGSTFAGWTGACSGTGACQVTMDAAKSVTTTFTLNTYTLTVAKTGTGTGTVTSTPGGIACGGDCSEPYGSGTVVALSPTASAGSTFTGWIGSCTGTGACQVTMNAAKAVTATFTLTPVSYTLTVAKAGTGSGTVASSPTGINCGADCSEPYGSGTVVTLSQTPTGGSTFTGWSGACTGTGACRITLDAAKSVTATFTLTPVSYTLSVTRAGDGSGTVASSPAGISCGADCSEPYNSGTLVALTPTPVSGSVFAGWGGACAGTGACQITINAAKSVTATFALGMYTLNVTKTGTGSGTVTSSPAGISCGSDCSEPYNRGTVVSLTATPATGSLFSGWSGACSGTIGCQATMDATRSATATFSTASGPPPPGDFNRDGSSDLLWHHQASGSLYVWLLRNSKTVGGAYLTPDRFTDTRWQIRGLIDFNNDGHTDVLWHHQTTGELYVWLMNGMTAASGTYLTPSRFADTNWRIRGLGHFNADGKIDILWHHQKTGDLYVWFMSGATAISGSYLTPSRFTDTNWQIRGLADFNGDGKADVLWHHQKSGDLYVWLMNGTTSAGGSYLTPSRFADTRWQIVRVADFNGDGRNDILWHHQQTGDLYAWYLNGTVTVSGGYLTPSRFADTNWKVAPR